MISGVFPVLNLAIFSCLYFNAINDNYPAPGGEAQVRSPRLVVRPPGVGIGTRARADLKESLHDGQACLRIGTDLAEIGESDENI